MSLISHHRLALSINTNATGTILHLNNQLYYVTHWHRYTSCIPSPLVTPWWCHDCRIFSVSTGTPHRFITMWFITVGLVTVRFCATSTRATSAHLHFLMHLCLRPRRTEWVATAVTPLRCNAHAVQVRHGATWGLRLALVQVGLWLCLTWHGQGQTLHFRSKIPWPNYML